MDKHYILFIDSGIGGVSIMQHLLNLRDNLNILYCADTLHFPYGTKEEGQIGSYLLNIYEALKTGYSIIQIVIACNTASVSALAFLRKHVNIPVVGTVPAVKVAAEQTILDRFGVIATNTTVKIDYLSNLIKEFAGGKKVFVRPAQKLVDTVENCYLNGGSRTGIEIEKALEEELHFFKDKQIDYLVLGCTHYSFLYDEIGSYFENKVTVVDSREGVSRRILFLLGETNTGGTGERLLFLTDPLSMEKYTAFNKGHTVFSKISCLNKNTWAN